MSDPDESGTTRVRDLVVRAHGSTVLVLHRSTADEESAGLLGAVPVDPGDGLVLASPAAVQAGGFRTALRKACRAAVSAAERTRRAPADRPRLWLAVPALGERGRGRPQGQKLAREFDAEVFAPSGPVRLVAGGCVYAGDEDHRWMRFVEDAPGEAHGTRYPRPGWEDRLPRGSGYDGTLHLRPVPAGLAAVPGGGEPLLELAKWIPFSADRPRLVLGGRGLVPHQAAALLRRFPEAVRTRMQLVPLDQATATGEWRAELVRMLGHEVVSTVGPLQRQGEADSAHLVDVLGAPTWRPFAAALRHGPDGRVTVVQANPPPRGWVPAGPLSYRWGGSTELQPTPHEITAKVVPAGLALVPASKAASSMAADRLAFEPDRLTITVGVPCTAVPEGVALALNRVLSGLDREQLARVRILVLGVADRAARSALLAASGELRGRIAFPKVLAADLGHEEQSTLRMQRTAAAPAEAQRVERTQVIPSAAVDAQAGADARVERTQVISRADLAVSAVEETAEVAAVEDAPVEEESAAVGEGTPGVERTVVVDRSAVEQALAAAPAEPPAASAPAAEEPTGEQTPAEAAPPTAAGPPNITMSSGPAPTSGETVRVDVAALRTAAGTAPADPAGAPREPTTTSSAPTESASPTERTAALPPVSPEDDAATERPATAHASST
ncbi:hypothetical protein ACL03H_22835 [Saccharopolyspora sp. MS10]|uniref:hypothetical protein n=1 Tax=Saccharopolyspora sp. MS10 TaxID=3385973 RepID=UPI0039A3514F